MASGCAAACLYSAGRGRFTTVQQARIRKTRFFFDERKTFMHRLNRDIASLIGKAEREGMQPCVRLNGTSDIRWETVTYFGATVFEAWPDVRFYDYTKLPNRRHDFENYHLTYSWSEHPLVQKTAYSLLESEEMNVARVFCNKSRPGVYSTRWDLPEYFHDYRIVDGDEHDLRFLDPEAPNWVGLRAKAAAVTDTTGFVTSIHPAGGSAGFERKELALA